MSTSLLSFSATMYYFHKHRVHQDLFFLVLLELSDENNRNYRGIHSSPRIFFFFIWCKSVVRYSLLVRAVLLLILWHTTWIILSKLSTYSVHYRLNSLLLWYTYYCIYCLSQQLAHSCRSSRMLCVYNLFLFSHLNV